MGFSGWGFGVLGGFLGFGGSVLGSIGSRGLGFRLPEGLFGS